MKRRYAKMPKWRRENLHINGEEVIVVKNTHWTCILWPAVKLAAFVSLIALRMMNPEYNLLSGGFEDLFLGIPYWIGENLRGLVNVIEFTWLAKHGLRNLKRVLRNSYARYYFTPYHIHARGGTFLKPRWDSVPYSYCKHLKEYTTTIFLAPFKVGTVELTSGRDGIALRNVKNPQTVGLVVYGAQSIARREAREARLNGYKNNYIESRAVAS